MKLDDCFFVAVMLLLELWSCCRRFVEASVPTYLLDLFWHRQQEEVVCDVYIYTPFCRHVCAACAGSYPDCSHTNTYSLSFTLWFRGCRELQEHFYERWLSFGTNMSFIVCPPLWKAKSGFFCLFWSLLCWLLLLVWLLPSQGDSDTDSEVEDRVDGVKSWLSKNKGSAKNLSDDGSLKSSRSVERQQQLVVNCLPDLTQRNHFNVFLSCLVFYCHPPKTKPRPW